MSDDERAWAGVPFIRVYYTLPNAMGELWDDDACLAAEVRLLMAADAMWPAPAPIPTWLEPAVLERLVAAGLIRLEGRAGYTMAGLAKERQARNGGRAAGGRAREGSAERNPDGTFAPASAPATDQHGAPATSPASASISQHQPASAHQQQTSRGGADAGPASPADQLETDETDRRENGSSSAGASAGDDDGPPVARPPGRRKPEPVGAILDELVPITEPPEPEQHTLADDDKAELVRLWAAGEHTEPNAGDKRRLFGAARKHGMAALLVAATGAEDSGDPHPFEAALAELRHPSAEPEAHTNGRAPEDRFHPSAEWQAQHIPTPEFLKPASERLGPEGLRRQAILGVLDGTMVLGYVARYLQPGDSEYLSRHEPPPDIHPDEVQP